MKRFIRAVVTSLAVLLAHTANATLLNVEAEGTASGTFVQSPNSGPVTFSLEPWTLTGMTTSATPFVAGNPGSLAFAAFDFMFTLSFPGLGYSRDFTAGGYEQQTITNDAILLYDAAFSGLIVDISLPLGTIPDVGEPQVLGDVSGVFLASNFDATVEFFSASGEVTDFIVTAKGAAPEPPTLALLGLGLLAARRRMFN